MIGLLILLTLSPAQADGYESRAWEIADMKADRYQRLVQECWRKHGLDGLTPDPGWTEELCQRQASKWRIDRYGTKKEKKDLKRRQDLYDISAEVFGGKSQVDISLWARQTIDNPWKRIRFMALTRKWPLNDAGVRVLEGIIEGVQKEAMIVYDREGNPILDENGEEIDILGYIDYQLNDSDIPWSDDLRHALEVTHRDFLKDSFDRPTDQSRTYIRRAYDRIQKEARLSEGRESTSPQDDLLEGEVDETPEATPTPSPVPASL